MISKTFSQLSLFPFLFYSAAVFYVLLAVVFVSKNIRSKFRAVFLPPVPSTHSQMTPLDAFRGFAALWVCIYHLWFLTKNTYGNISSASFVSHGQIAVSVFATLSGLLIYRSIRNIEFSSKEMRMYLQRRFLRIYPLYFFSLVIGVLCLCLTTGGFGDLGIRGYVADIFMIRVFGFPDFFGLPSWDPQVWSLYCEVLFYIVLPVFVVASGRKTLAVSVFCFLLISLIGDRDSISYFMWLLKFFLIGIILCEIISRNYFNRFMETFSPLILVSGIFLFALCCNNHPVIDDFLNYVYKGLGLGEAPYTKIDFSITVAVASVFTIIGGLKSKTAHFILSLYPFRYAGIISYSIYLMHNILFRFVFWGSPANALPKINLFCLFIFMFLPMILLYSSISYAVIERPFLKLRPSK